MNNYDQTLEAEENENEEDTSKFLDEIVRKRPISTQSLGDCPSIKDDDDDKKEMNGVAKGRGQGISTPIPTTATQTTNILLNNRNNANNNNNKQK